jgi:hypothetical protein
MARTIRSGCAAVFAIALVPLGLLRAEDAPASLVPLDQLTKRLEQSIDGRIDIELKSGKSYLRCKLMRVVPGERPGQLPKSLKFQEDDAAKPTTIGFGSVRSISVDREQIFQAVATTKSSGKEAIAQRESKAAAAEREKWMASARARGARIWPELTAEEHKAEEKKTREKIDKIKGMYPGTALYETHEFLFVSDMPREQVAPFTASLDKMYDMMCQMYGIKKGASVWKGKCLIVVFLGRADYVSFEEAFFQHTPPEFSQGLCNSSSDGEVVMVCYRGNDVGHFSEMLVHETSHGFIHRYRTLARLPSWVNEGMAEWIAQSLIGYPGGVKLMREQALRAMQQTHSLQGMFQADHINPIQYGMAAHLTDFLIIKDKRKYAQWINGMKEGRTWEESLKEAYGLTAEQLVGEFGLAIGLPDLRP